MIYGKLNPDELNAFIRGYSRVGEIAKMFCSKCGSIYTYYELRIYPHQSYFTFRVGQSTSGTKLYTPTDYASIPLHALTKDGEDLEDILDDCLEKFKYDRKKEDERLKSLRCDKCGRGGNTEYYFN